MKGRRNLANTPTVGDRVNRNFCAPSALWLTDVTEHNTLEVTL